MNEMPMTRAELKDALADYLADELPPEARTRFEAGLRDHADLADEARSLAGAAQAMRALAGVDAGSAASRPARRAGAGMTWRIARLAAMLALAFGLGYAARGPGSAPGAGATMAERPAGDVQGDTSLEARYAMKYLADGRRSGLGRALVAFSRAVNEESSSMPPMTR